MRELRASDAERVAALFVDCYGEARPIDAEEIRSWLRNSELEPEWLRVLEEDGRIVGYGDVWPQHEQLWLDVASPSHAATFFEWAELEARAHGSPRVRIQIPHGHALATVAAERGYEPWRHSLTMEIALDAPPHRPPLPQGLELRPYRDEDAEQLREALNEAFADDPFHEDISPSNFREFFLEARAFDPTLWLLAWDAAELAGFNVVYPERGSDATLGWVNTLGVRGPWRRRGLGEALLRIAFADLYARGLRRVGLGVDAANVTGALRLYERVGMHQVLRSDNWQKDV
ncbi:MAG TPA: GNAT family N-acetyltransferase [Gaiellaceae bacterium]